jgi:hypothetical protein
MNGKRIFATAMYLSLSFLLRAQENNEYHILRFSSVHTPFPDTGRTRDMLDGDNVLRTVAGHYDDSSVLLIVPNSLKPGQRIDLVFWFHGWHNSIDTALQFYGLATQFAASRCNAVLVLVEAAKNSADSYGGKLKQKGMFRELVNDVMAELKNKNVVPAAAEPGHIVLAGHSGGFLVIANILENGQMPVDEVFLFDALYSQVPIFMDWINADKAHHFIHWYTNHGGGTDEMSDFLMSWLRLQHTGYLLVEEKSVTPEVIRSNRVLLVHSQREHNVIINNPDDFRLLLENSGLIVF